MKSEHKQPRIELIFDADCPNVDQVRQVLEQALLSMGMEKSWLEYDRLSPQAPEYTHQYGSPTILVNQQDVSPAVNNQSACCRVYLDNTDFKGCPDLDSVIIALKNATGQI